MKKLQILILSYLITMLFSYPSQPKYRVHSFVSFFWKNQRMTFRSFWKPIFSFKGINDFSMNLFLNLLLHDINCKDLGLARLPFLCGLPRWDDISFSVGLLRLVNFHRKISITYRVGFKEWPPYSIKSRELF